MKNILIVGAGQLGSRHLQAMALIEEPYAIYVVDPSNESLKISRARFEEVVGYNKHTISYHNELNALSLDYIDVAVIATTSNVRSAIIKEIINKKKVRYFILEKVLFQSEQEYYEIGKLFEISGSKAFVNCPRRMNDFYQNIRSSDFSKDPIQMEVIGNNWGLGCNGIHFVDLFNFLSNDIIIKWQNNLDNCLINSKRDDFKEFTGNISGIGLKGNRLSLTCYNSGNSNLSIRLSSPNTRYIINETAGKVWKEELKANWETEELSISMILQSNLTQEAVRQLFESGTCMLTPYSVSCSLHTPFILTLLSHFNKIQNSNVISCPIT